MLDGLLKIYGPGNQEFSEVLCNHCTPSTHVLCPVDSSKSWMGNKARRSFCCAAGMKVSITGPGLCLCCVSTSSRFISFPVSPICMCGQKYLGKKNSFCFLTLVLKHGRWQLSFRVSSSRLWLTVSKHGLSGFASSSPLLSAAVFTEVLLLNWPKQIPQWQP